MRVGVNLHDRMESTQAKYFAVRAVSPHPSYNKHVILNDIAILTLVRPVPRMIHGRPTRRIELPAAQETTAPDTPLLTVGWGDLREGMRDIPRLLQGTRLRLLSPTACQARIGNMLPSSQICVDNTQSDTCQVRPEPGQFYLITIFGSYIYDIHLFMIFIRSTLVLLIMIYPHISLKIFNTCSQKHLTIHSVAFFRVTVVVRCFRH